MMQFLAAIEQSGFSVWVRESNSLLAYPGVLFLHTFGMGVVAGISGLIALRILGCAREVPLADVRKMYPYMWAGFYLNTVTGIVLFVIDATTKIIDPVFYIKLAFATIVCWTGAITAGRLLAYVGPGVIASSGGK